MNTYLNDILEDLCNFALSHGIGITLNHEFSPAMKSLADTRNRKILINTGQPDQQQIPFQVAHEISHVMTNDKSTHLLAFNSIHSDPQIETRANRGAVDMLLPYYTDERQIEQLNVNEFMTCFDIPAHLEKIVAEEFQKYRDQRL
ncbi:hypothetical protein IWT140_02234 [Secundilactobacillus pentosiphilus]|uniref:IrrE N-terminal-like domain-containing protein n=1 Tax=Secundilactobacillus pentosiphilus TaxID=1714682 RepID=A0A1Z5ISM9_9LACO|nr:ImmA/IrrE family metallo-endopeptidase [Secundilactobacillus pentosiphilus]GAX04592.1 hypothetical protein IWT140_02234 [Secundilactobacillus pentosiphilus]